MSRKKKSNHGKYYYELLNTLKKIDKECFICESKESLQPHHIRQVKPTNSQYSSEDNLVFLCKYHHEKYHNQYNNVNQKTFALYCIRQKQKEINKLKKG